MGRYHRGIGVFVWSSTSEMNGRVPPGVGGGGGVGGMGVGAGNATGPWDGLFNVSGTE